MLTADSYNRQAKIGNFDWKTTAAATPAASEDTQNSPTASNTASPPLSISLKLNAPPARSRQRDGVATDRPQASERELQYERGSGDKKLRRGRKTQQQVDMVAAAMQLVSIAGRVFWNDPRSRRVVEVCEKGYSHDAPPFQYCK